MKKKERIKKASLFVRKALECREGGHDWLHVERVMKNAKKILKSENADELIVYLGVLFHDIADPKFVNSDPSKGSKIASAFLKEIEIPPEKISRIIDIIENVSYQGGFDKKENLSKELKIVRDADRLDAMGAIGIARAFNYGGYAGRKMYDPSVPPRKYSSAEEYRNSDSPTLNHFFEKLFHIKKNMYTKTAKKLAKKRHTYMSDFVKELYNEIDGKS